MATTTNYGWTTPDDTALVKDGAAAIRTLGSSVDSTLKTQIDNTVASSIQKTLTSTTGDIIYASGANTPARLGIGSSGQLLTVSGGLPAWTTPTSGGLTLLSTTSLSGTSTSITGISGSYKNLQIIVQGTQVSANAQLFIKFNATNITCSNVGAIGTTLGNGTQVGALGCDVQLTAGRIGTYTLNVYNYANTSYNKTFSGAGGIVTLATNGAFYCGDIQTTSAITSIQVTTLAGTSSYTAGQVLIYGVN
jgi:hypothetical protein